MIFAQTISTPASTAAASPQSTTFPVGKGVIHRLRVAFPPGPQGLLHVQIYRGQAQIWPSRAGQSFAWDAFAFDAAEWYEVDADPLEFTVVTWNTDTEFAHQVMVSMDQLPLAVLRPPSAELPLLQRLSRAILGR